MGRLLLTLARSRRSAALDVLACVLVGLAVTAGVLLVALMGFVVWLAVWLGRRHPFCTVGLVATGLMLAGGGWAAVAGLWIGLAATTLAWRWRDRDGFDRRVLRRWRRTFVYGPRWRRAMVSCDLDQVRGRRRRVPRLGAVRSTRWTDRIGLHLLEGQTAEMVATRSGELAGALGALACRVRDAGPGVVSLELRRGDPLSGPLAPLAVPDRPDLDALVVGVHEDGRPWTVRLARGHVLVVGAAGTGDGSGRESVVWSLVRALAARLPDGSVELWGIDGTGLGLAVGARLFSRLATDDRDAGVAIVEEAAALVRARRRQGSALPPVVLVLDEVVRWGDLLDDDLRRRLNPSMELVLTHGPAAGVIVVAALRTAPASVASWFRQRVHVGGDGVACAVERRVAHRVRAASVSDEAVAAMARHYGRRPVPSSSTAPCPPVSAITPPPVNPSPGAGADARPVDQQQEPGPAPSRPGGR
jgi:S-DNA-T family DNA segregation ATPase FtsK/SpoIIIE